MMKFVCLFALVAFASAQQSVVFVNPETGEVTHDNYYFPPPKDSRISCYDCVEAQPNEFPHQVRVGTIRGLLVSMCGGSIIHANWVMTAAHCVDPLGTIDEVEILTGDEPNQILYIASQSDIIQHEAYNGAVIQNDITLIYISEGMDLDGTYRDVALIPSRDDPFVEEGDEAQVSGFGSGTLCGGTQSDVLMKKVVNARTITDCQDYYGPAGEAIVTNDTICTDPAACCSAGSGGPLNSLITPYYTAGISSFVSSAGCRTGPGAFTRTRYFGDWVCTNTNGDVCVN